VATYQQVGDFEVVSNHGRLQKNGGNVASYFCTPDALVVHAIAQPVQPEKLLTAARFAVQAFEQAEYQSPQDIRGQRAVVERAHLEQLHSQASTFEAHVKSKLTEAQRSYYEKLKKLREASSYDRQDKRPDPPMLVARRQAAQQLGGSRAHQIMVAQPLAPLADVFEEVFEKLTNERVIDDRSIVFAASEGLKQARESGTPILFVVYSGKGHNKDEWDSSTKKLVEEAFRSPQMIPVLRHYVVIFLPKRQLAALSNLADLPVYQVSSSSGPQMFTIHASGEQDQRLSTSAPPLLLAQQLWPQVHAAWMIEAGKLSQQGEYTQSLKLLQQITHGPIAEQRRLAVAAQIQQVQFLVAEQWAAAGRRTSALRMFTTLSRTSLDSDLRERASQSIAQLRADLP
jgi:hypothetical protein